MRAMIVELAGPAPPPPVHRRYGSAHATCWDHGSDLHGVEAQVCMFSIVQGFTIYLWSKDWDADF